jgi:hypothetical protein
VSPRNRSNNNATGDLVAVMMSSMMERQQRAEEEREDRRVQQPQSQMMASFMGSAAPAQTRHAGIGDDEADDSWEIVGGGVGKPKDDRDYP